MVWGAQRDKVWGHSSSLLFLKNVIGSWDDGPVRSVLSERYVGEILEGCHWLRGWLGGRWSDASQGREGQQPGPAHLSGLSAWWLKRNRERAKRNLKNSAEWVREHDYVLFMRLSLWLPGYLLALYAGDNGVSPTGDKGQRYSWIWSMLIAQFRIASLWWWIVDGLQTQHF